jgi:hypothetical protein
MNLPIRHERPTWAAPRVLGYFNMRPVNTIFVELDLLDGSMTHADTGIQTNTLMVVPTQNTTQGQYVNWTVPDSEAHYVSMNDTTAFTKCRITLKNESGRVIFIPANFHVDLVMKLYHNSQ